MPVAAEGVTLEGSVYDRATGQALAGVSVSVSGGLPGPAVITESHGSYKLTGLRGAKIALEVNKEGCATLDWLNSPDTRIDLPASGTVTRNMYLEAAAYLSGTIIDWDSEKPIDRVSVTALQEDYMMGVKRYVPAGDGRGTLAKNGRFTITGLRPGTYLLELHPARRSKPNQAVRTVTDTEDLDYGHKFFPNARSTDGAAPLHLAADEKRRLIVRLQKEPLRSVEGIVSLPEGATGPVKYIVEENAPGFHRHVTQGSFVKDGPFSIGGLSEGDYSLLVFTEDESGATAFVERRISVGNRGLQNLKLVLEPAITIAGTITAEEGNPVLPDSLGEVVLQPVLRTSIGGDGRPVQVAKNGEFRLERIFPGTYFFTVGQLPSGWAVRRILYKQSEVTDRSLAIENGSIDSSLSVFLTAKLSTVNGVVRDSEGRPRQATLVLAPEQLPDDFRPLALPVTETDSEGRFHFSGIVEGRYKVVALSGPEANSPRNFAVLREKMTGLETIEVAPGRLQVLQLKL